MRPNARTIGLLPAVIATVGIGLMVQAPAGSQSPSPRGSQATEVVNGHPAVAGEVLVKFESASAAASNNRTLGDSIDADINIPVGRRGLQRFRSRIFDVETLLAYFRGQPGVVYAEPNYIVTTTATPNDPRFPELWGLHNTGQPILGIFGIPDADIDATEAWDVSTGSSNIVVGVIDTGIDYLHPDLAPNVWSAPSAFTIIVSGAPLTCPAGSHGFNAILRTCDPMDDRGHGTHVSGTIGAVGNNALGVAGVNWTTKIIGGKFLNSGGSGTTSDAIESIEFMVQTKAFFGAAANIRVLNNSWGGGGFSTALRDAIVSANSANMLFAAAAGNANNNNDVSPFYPATYDVDNIVSVAATNNQDLRAGFSNYGTTTVDLAAPGANTLSTTRGGGYGYSSGTSMATPHVAGAAALVLSECSLSTAALKANLLSNDDNLASLFGLVASNGRLNVNRAIRACAGGGPDVPAPPTGLLAVAGDSRVDLSWSASAGATGYRVKRSTVSGGPFLQIAEVTSPSFVDFSVVNGTTYFYAVSAVNAAGESGNSTEASATPTGGGGGGGIPLPPTGVTAVSGPEIGQITISWEASEGATSYKVKRSRTPGGPYGTGKKVVGLTVTQSGLGSGRRYYYVVTAKNSLGESAFSVEVSAVAR